MTDLFNPSAEHRALRELVRSFTEREVDPQAEQSDHAERFNVELFRKLGELGLLGITVEERFGGAGLDPVAAVIAHEELAAADPGFTLAFLAHSIGRLHPSRRLPDADPKTAGWLEREGHRLRREVPGHWAEGLELLDWLELG